MPRPGIYIPITDKRTKKTYEMPWHDATIKPSRQEIDDFIYDQENKSVTQKVGDWAFEPLTHIPSRAAKYLGGPLRRYAEGNPLDFPLLPPIGGSVEKQGDYGWTRKLANVASAYGETLGEEVDNLTSPASLVTFGAGPIGRRLPGLAGTAISKIPKVAAGGMVGHGVYSGEQALENPSGNGVIEDLKGPALETGLGALGLFGGRRPAKPLGLNTKVATPPAKPTVSEGLLGRPNMRSGSGPVIGDIPSYGEGMPNYRGGSSSVPIPDNLTPEGLAETFAQRARETTKSRLQAEIDAENLAEGFKPAKPRVAKPPVRPTPEVIESENLRNPWAEERGKYSKSILDEIDTETLSNPDIANELHQGVVADIRKRLGKKAPGYTEPPPSAPKEEGPKRQSWKNSPAWKRAKSERGSLNIDLEGLAEDFQSGVGKAKNYLGDLRQKGLQKLEDVETKGNFGKLKSATTLARKGAAAVTGPDVTDASLRSYLQSGWAYLEKSGEPGKKIARILKRQRMDVEAEIEEAKAAGTHLTNAKGTPVNYSGGIINERHGARIRELMQQIPEGEQRKKAQAIVDEFIGKSVDPRKAFSRDIDVIRGLEGATKLSQFAIANPAGVVPIAMRGNLGSVAKNIKRVLPVIGDFKQAELEARPSGYIHEVAGNAMDETGRHGLAKVVDKLFRITGSEKRMRTLATLVGRDTSENLFQSLKANPTSKALRKQLDDLILEDDLDAVLKQDRLTPAQVRRAGGRMNELTQGIAEGIDLPPQWTGSASADLMTQFKKYGFVQSRNMKEAFFANPGKTLAAGGIIAPVVGEAIGDVKAMIKGATVTAFNEDDQDKAIDNIMEEIKARGTGGERYVNDMSQAWALGLFGDILKGSSRGDRGLLETISGPFWGDLSEAAFGIHELLTKGQSFRLRRQLARAIPVIGTGVASTIKGDYTGRQGRRPRRKRSRRTRD